MVTAQKHEQKIQDVPLSVPSGGEQQLRTSIAIGPDYGPQTVSVLDLTVRGHRSMHALLPTP